MLPQDIVALSAEYKSVVNALILSVLTSCADSFKEYVTRSDNLTTGTLHPLVNHTDYGGRSNSNNICWAFVTYSTTTTTFCQFRARVKGLFPACTHTGFTYLAIDLDQTPAAASLAANVHHYSPGYIIQGKRKCWPLHVQCRPVHVQCRPVHVLAAGVSSSKTFSVYDRHTGQSFLLDTGADVSVYPVAPQDHKTNPLLHLCLLLMQLPLRPWANTTLFWKLDPTTATHTNFISPHCWFVIAHELITDVKGKCLLFLDDASVFLKSMDSSLTLAGLLLHPRDEHSDLLHPFRELFTPRSDSTVNKHGGEQHFTTYGPPVHARARRLNPEKNGRCKSCILEDRTRVSYVGPTHRGPRIQNFNYILTECKIFSKTDLARDYHQIAMTPSSDAKTAILTPFGLWQFICVPFGLKNAA